MSTGVNDLFHPKKGLIRAVRRKLARIKWKGALLKQSFMLWAKRKKGCEYWNCPDCYCGGEVKLRGAMTAYHWDKESGKPDPNPDFIACDNHWQMYHDHWKEQWDEYYSGLL